MGVPIVEVLHADTSARIEAPDLSGSADPGPVKSQGEAMPEPTGAEIPATTVAKLKALKDVKRKRIFEAIFEGKSFAPAGERDAAMQAAASTIAWADEGKTRADVLAELLRPSLAAWAAEPGADKSLDDEISKAVEKISRAAKDWAETHGRRRQALECLRSVLVPETPDAPPPAPEFKHLALQRDRVFYVWSFTDNTYWPAHTMRELPIVLRDAWPDGCPAELIYWDDKGNPKRKNTAQALDEYGTALRDVVYSLYQPTAQYNPATRVLLVPQATRRPLEPEYHPQIDEWLRIMPARPHHLDMLLDWIATTPLLDKMNAALYLSGPGGTGKGLLATGLGRLWTAGPSKLKHALHRFNDSLLRNPLAWLDESWKEQGTNLCAEIREITGAMTHQIEPKGQPVVTVEGAIRMIITANSETILNTKGNGDPNQFERAATIERILHVPVSDEAGKYLKSVKDRDSWREDNLIAKHALWLEQERSAQILARARDEGHRFLVQGDPTDSEFYDGIGSRPKDYDAATAWFSCLFTMRWPPAMIGLVAVGEGKIVVVPRALCVSWKSFGLQDVFDLPTSSHQAARIIRPFCGPRTKLGGLNGYKIDVPRLRRVLLDEGLIKAPVFDKKIKKDFASV